MARRQLNICYLTKKSNAITRLAESLRPAYPKIAAWQTSNPEELFSDKRPDIIIADPDFRTSELPKSALYVIKQKEAQKFIKDSSVQFITEDELGTHAFVRAIGNIIEQERLLTQLQESSIKDELTGLYNKKFMLDILGKEVKKSIRYHTPLSILFVGADGMKKINEHGHGIGDQVIMDLGIIISQSVREVDVAGRFDGDEFIAILPETTLENSSHVCKRIQYTTKNFAFANGEPGLAVTVSMGVSELEGNLRSREDLVESARQALAGAKKRGPGSICTWEEAKTKADPVKENAAIISSVRHQIALLSEETEKNHYKNLMKLFESMSSYKRRQHHSERVAFYSEKLSQKIDLGKEETASVKNAALLHDIGLLAIDERIIMKPGVLNGNEFNLIKQHPVIAAQMLNQSVFMKNEINIILHHHERFDSNGYPDHLNGTHIPIGSRIISLAEAWDTMISQQSYRDALPLDQALSELKKNSAKQFDPEIVTTFTGMIENG